MARLLELSDGRSRLKLAPEMGGGIAGFEALTPDGPVPVLRGWDGSDDPFAMACNVLVPFSNRISGGGFTFDGVFHPVPCNLDGQECPIHGDGFQRAWRVEDATGNAASLSLPEGAIGPFRYSARLDYRLQNGALTSTLTVTNTGPRLPFGGGFHPWLPRAPETRLAFAAAGVWQEDARHLPTDHLDLRSAPEWDYAAPRPLPDGWINNAFTGWLGGAVIDQPSLGIAVEIAAPAMDVAIVFSPSRESDFFCFEPVSHPVDAINRPDLPGLRVLDPGDSLRLSMSIDWRDTPLTPA